MKKSLRPALTAGVAVISAVAIAIAPVGQGADAHRTPRHRRSVSSSPPSNSRPRFSHERTRQDPSLGGSNANNAGLLPNLLADFLRRIAVPPSASAPFPTPQFPPVVGGNSVQQRHQEHLQRRRAVGGVGVRGRRLRGRLGSVCRLAGAADHDLLLPRRTHRAEHHVQHRRLDRRGYQLRSRAWSTSASTPSTRSSSLQTTNWRSGCRRCRRFRPSAPSPRWKRPSCQNRSNRWR